MKTTTYTASVLSTGYASIRSTKDVFVRLHEGSKWEHYRIIQRGSSKGLEIFTGYVSEPDQITILNNTIEATPVTLVRENGHFCQLRADVRDLRRMVTDVEHVRLLDLADSYLNGFATLPTVDFNMGDHSTLKFVRWIVKNVPQYVDLVAEQFLQAAE